MSVALRIKLGVSAAGLSCLLVGYAQAQRVEEQIKPAQYADQNTGQPVSDQSRPSGRQQAIPGERTTTHFRGPEAAGSTAANATQGVDHYLANCLLINNQAEIEISEFAKERAETDEVKEFAQEMVDDHRQLADKLEKIAMSNRSSNRNLAGNDAGLNQLLEIDRQITEKCTQMTRDELERKSGKEFDQCYVGAQIGSHIHMVAALDVISEQASGELRQIAEDAKSKVKDHLQHAKKLAEKMQSDKES